jgi:hypothetical protein
MRKTKALIVLVAGFSLTKLGDITPEEQVWIQENSVQQQKLARNRKYNFVTKLAALMGCGEYEALVALNTAPQLRTVGAASAIEWIGWQDEQQKEVHGTIDGVPVKDNDLEYLTYMVNSRLEAGTKGVTYEEIMKLSEADRTALYEFISKELGYEETNPEASSDPVGENSADSSLPAQEIAKAHVITG